MNITLGWIPYLLIGLLVHVLVIGTHLDWMSAWTYIYIGLWPLVLLYYFSLFALCLIAACLIVCGIGWLYANR